MGFKTYGFMQDKDWYEDVGHIILGSLPIDILWYIREHTTVKMPWPFKGQYPPGKPMWLFTNEDDQLRVAVDEARARSGYKGAGHDLPFEDCSWEYFPADRVHDSKRDELGRSIGAQLRPIWVALIAWSIMR